MIDSSNVNNYDWWQFYSSKYDRFLIGQIKSKVYEGEPPNRKFSGEFIIHKIVNSDGSQFRYFRSSGTIHYDSEKVDELTVHHINLIKKISQ